MLKDALWLAKKEIATSWKAYALTVLTTILVAMVVTFFLQSMAIVTFTDHELANIPRTPAIDVFFIAFSFAFATLYMSKPYLSFNTIKEDTFSKRIAFYRLLPIPIQTLALSKTLVMLFTLVLMSVVFYTILFITLTEQFFELIPPANFLHFALLWFGFSLAFGGVNTYIEYGTSGKTLFIFPFIFVGIILGISFYLQITEEHGIVAGSLIYVLEYGKMLAIVSIILGIVGSIFWHKMLLWRLRVRDYR